VLVGGGVTLGGGNLAIIVPKTYETRSQHLIVRGLKFDGKSPASGAGT